jgi:hypothetical protein
MQRSSCVPAVMLAAAALACSDSPAGPEGQGTVVFQLATTGSGATASSALSPSLSVSVTRGADVIVIEDVQLVARKIKLESEDAACEDDESEVAGAESDEDCPELKLGPLLLDPPLNDGAETEFLVTLPAGSYDELQLQIHKPTSTGADQAFVLANPDFAGISIRVTGTRNGAPFTFTTDLTQVIEIELNDPIVVVADGETALTLLLDVRGWFLGQGGGTLLNPLNLTQEDRSRIEHNIQQSFHAFEDEDHDGDDDTD